MLVRGGLVVKRMRELRGYKQNELALGYGVCVNTISNWERGETEPSFLEVFTIGEHLKFEIPEIYSMVNDINTSQMAKVA
jgi:DNA-binding XRE family transcriptional regulator